MDPSRFDLGTCLDLALPPPHKPRQSPQDDPHAHVRGSGRAGPRDRLVFRSVSHIMYSVDL